MLRLPLLFVTVGLMYCQIPLGATFCFLFYLTAAWSDWLDGYLARRCNMVSTFGKFMDALTDKIFMIGLFMALLVFGLLPHWSLFLILNIMAREFLVTGVRLIASSRGVVLVAKRTGKLKAALQVITIGFFLLRHMIVRDFTFLPQWVGSFIYNVALTLLWISTYLTISSGCYYMYRYRFLFEEQRGIKK
jgi:CDP-diacylglycerol--glycerol-3-phosphate 3-phosphatidyltransferase